MITQIPLGLSNAFLLRGQAPVLVDTGSAGDAQRLRAALAGHGVQAEDLALILHTHGHWDHAGSTAQFKAWTNAPAAIHGADAEKMAGGHNGVLRPTGLSGWLLRPLLDRRFPACVPDLVIDGEFDLHPYGVPARAVPAPGHTLGSIVVLTHDGDAIVGDTVMGGFFGGKIAIRRPTLHYFAEDLDLMKRSVVDILKRGTRRIYSGHGGPLDPRDVERWLARVR